tara:strand:+ start:864 stop:1703 length:840 start_codon:yes stop_codon:yes gene_type:complete
MGGAASGSKSKSKSSFQDKVWGGQSGALQDLYGNAQDLFNQTNTGMQGLQPGATQNMQDTYNQVNPAYQEQLQGGAYRDMGLQNQLMGSLNQSMNQPSAMSQINAMTMGGEGNNYADAMKDQYIQDANRAQDRMMANTDARAAASMMSGGSRHGIAQGLGMESINDSLQSNLAKTGYDTFEADLQRKLDIAQQADQGNLARQQMMSGMIGQQNQAQQGAIQGGQNMQNINMGQYAPQMMPWDAIGEYGNVIGRPTILGSGSQSGSSGSLSASGGVGGGK